MKNPEIAIIGCGELSSEFLKRNPNRNVLCFNHSQKDLTIKADCDALIPEVVSADAVLITAGVFDRDPWQTWLVNTLGPCYVLQLLIRNGYQGQVILISSNSANWSSWPGAELDRIIYNSSKQALSNFASACVQKGVSCRISVIEPSRFQSAMSGYTGIDIGAICAVIEDVLWGNLKTCYNIKLSNQGITIE